MPQGSDARELREVMEEVKRMVTRMSDPSQLWDLERYRTQRRKEIDRKYDFRYSQLTEILGKLVHENRVSQEQLRRLREDKLNSIRSFAEFLAGRTQLERGFERKCLVSPIEHATESVDLGDRKFVESGRSVD